jgi:outer membrane protein OmpA-like peptidoglycan-associated protein
MVAKGYGETQPVAPNMFPNGKDNPEGRQKNRRVELKILEK